MEYEPAATNSHPPDTVSPRTASSLARLALGVLRCLPVVLVLAVVVALSFRSGGYIFPHTAPVVFLLIPLAAVWVWLAPRRLTLGFPAWVALAAFVAFTAWTGLSIVWSVGPDLSWLAFDVTALYLLVAVVVTVTPAGPAQLRLAGYGFVAAMVPVAVYAFLGKVLPDVVTHAHLYARLSAPLGYWNVLAIMLVMAIAPALEGASRRTLPAVARGACAGALALFAFTLFFAFSRGGTLALALALVVYFVLTNERLQGALSLVLTAVPVAAVLYHGRHLDTLFNATTNDALRTAQGHLFGPLGAGGDLPGDRRPGDRRARRPLRLARRPLAAGRRRRRPGRGLGRRGRGAASAFASRYGGVAGVAHKVAHQFTLVRQQRQSAHERRRPAARRWAATAVSPWPARACKGFRQHPLAGTGAGTFRFTNYLYRPSASFVVKHAHNQWINVLSELGLVGLVLFVLAVGGLVVAALRPVGRAARDVDRGLAGRPAGGGRRLRRSHDHRLGLGHGGRRGRVPAADGRLRGLRAPPASRCARGPRRRRRWPSTPRGGADDVHPPAPRCRAGRRATRLRSATRPRSTSTATSHARPRRTSRPRRTARLRRTTARHVAAGHGGRPGRARRRAGRAAGRLA